MRKLSEPAIDRARPHADRADVERADHMQAEHRLGLEVLEHAFLQHQRARRLPRLPARLPRPAGTRTAPCRADALRMPTSASATPSRIAVWASWPQACITPTVSPRYVPVRLRGERQRHLLGDRQRVHVGAQRDPRPGLAALEQRDHAGVGDAGAHFEAERAQVRRRPVRRCASRGCRARGAGGCRGAT